MEDWKDEQLNTLENAVAKYFRIMNASKREALTYKHVQHNIINIMKNNHDVTVSIGWLAKIFYEGAPAIQGGSWLAVQSFINTMHDPRITDHALQERRRMCI
jgi:hypothetical protein